MDKPHGIRGAYQVEFQCCGPSYYGMVVAAALLLPETNRHALPDRCRQLSCTLFPVPLFDALSRTKSTVTIFMLCFTGLLMLSGFTSIHMLLKTELFPARIRTLAVWLHYALTTAILGGTTEFVALRFKASGHEAYFFWYATIWAAISLLIYLRMSETHVRRAAVSQARLTA
jgi:MFS transporter, MHS family, alpha-ketoglutarate permease